MMKILICSDGSTQAENAARFASIIAGGSKAETTILGITEKSGEDDKIFDSLRRSQQLLKEKGVSAELIIKAGEVVGAEVERCARMRWLRELRCHSIRAHRSTSAP